MKVAYSGFLIAALATGPASADWQYSKWGMTPEQVIAASHQTARMASPSEEKANSPLTDNVTERALVVVPDYAAGDIHFSVAFDFDGQRHLCRVSLSLSDQSRNYDVRNALINKYGPPVDSKDEDIGVWLTGNDRIAYLLSIGALQYMPRNSAAAKAL